MNARNHPTTKARSMLGGLAMASLVSLAVLFGSGPALASVSVPVSSSALGDLNGDGQLDLLDQLRLRDIVLGLGAPPTAGEQEEGDLDQDGTVGAADLTALGDVLLGRRGVPHAIPPEGGSIVLNSPDGAVVTIDFPAGALANPLTAEARLAAPAAGSALAVDLGPGNETFLQPVTVTVVPPAGFTLGEGSVLFLGDPAAPALLPTTVDSVAGELTAEVRFFGLDSDTWVAPSSGGNAAQEISLKSHTPGHSCTITAQLNLANFTCQELVDEAQAALQDLEIGRDFVCATRFYLAASEVTSLAGCSAEANAWVQIAKTTACLIYDQAVQDAQASISVDFETLYQTVGRLIEGYMAVELLNGGLCAGQPDFVTIAEAEYTEFLQWFDLQLAPITAQPDSVAFRLLLERLRDRVLPLKEEAELLGFQNLAPAGGLIDSLSVYPSLEALRDAAYDICAADQDHSFLQRLAAFVSQGTAVNYFSSPFPFEDLWNDMQYCATAVSLESRSLLGNPSGLALLGGLGPGQKDSLDVLYADVDGSLVLGGSAYGLTCAVPPVLAWALDSLVIELDGLQIASVQQDVQREFFASPLVIDVDNDIEQALGILLLPGDLKTLTVRRIRPPAPCDDSRSGPQDFQLFAVDLVFEDTQLALESQFPDTVDVGQPTPLTVRARLEEPGSVTYPGGVDIQVLPQGSTVTPSAGVTDASGYFNADATLTTSPLELFIDALHASGLTAQDTVVAVQTPVAGAADVYPQQRLSLVSVGGTGCTPSEVQTAPTDFSIFDETVVCVAGDASQYSELTLEAGTGRLLDAAGSFGTSLGSGSRATAGSSLQLDFRADAPFSFTFDALMQGSSSTTIALSLQGPSGSVFSYDSEGSPPAPSFGQAGALPPGDYTLTVSVQSTVLFAATGGIVDWTFTVGP